MGDRHGGMSVSLFLIPSMVWTDELTEEILDMEPGVRDIEGCTSVTRTDQAPSLTVTNNKVSHLG